MFKYEPCSSFTSSLNHISDTNNLVSDLLNHSDVVGNLKSVGLPAWSKEIFLRPNGLYHLMDTSHVKT